MKAAVLSIALLLTGGQASTEQSPRLRWWQDRIIRQELALTAEQVTALHDEYETTLPQRRRLRALAAAADAKVAEALRRDLPEREVLPILDAAARAHTRRNLARTMMLLRMYRLLSPDQRARLKQLTRAPSTRTR